MAALVVLRNKAIKPLLAAAQELRPSRRAQNPRTLDTHYDTIRSAMRVSAVGAGRMNIDNYFFGLRP